MTKLTKVAERVMPARQQDYDVVVVLSAIGDTMVDGVPLYCGTAPAKYAERFSGANCNPA